MKLLKSFMTLCLVACCTFAFAQANYGVKAGVNYSLAYGTPEELNGEAIESVVGGVGFQIGALANFGLTDAVGLQVELMYEIRNSTKEVALVTSQTVPGVPVPLTVTIDGNSKNTYSLINVPVLFTFGGEKLTFYAGPNIAYMIGGTSETSSTQAAALPDGSPAAAVIEAEASIDQFNDDECGPCFKALEIGAQAGVTYNLNAGLGIDLRVGHSLTDFTDNDNDTSLLDPTQKRDDKDRHFYAQLGLQFKF